MIRHSFIVDYGQAVGDTTPPPAPTVLACGAVSPDTLSARWNVSDPESSIALYRYAIGTTPGSADVVNWTNTPLTSTTRVSLTLTAGQMYYVSVKARNEGGLWSEAGTSPGVVAGSGGCPTAGFTASPVSGPAPLSVQFTDVSTGSITSRLWSLGDGFTNTLISPTHVYTLVGVYTVSLQVTGPSGADSLIRASYISVTAPVSVPAPVAAFTASPRSGPPPLTVQFTDTSTGTIASWLWQFGDEVTSTLPSPTHTYALTGTFDVTLTVTGPGGSNTHVEPGYIHVRYGPVANFSANPRSGPRPLNVQFTDESAGTITGWLWDFGDTFTSTLQNPAHTYTLSGTYTVSLQVSGSGGDDSLTREGYITVTEPGWKYVYLPVVVKNP